MSLQYIPTRHKSHQGGIVDRNRLKGVTQNKAVSLNIKTARIPLKENIKLCASQVISFLSFIYTYVILCNFTALNYNFYVNFFYL